MISENLKIIRNELPENVTLVCVSKFHDQQAILEAYKAGERVFGESKVQELTLKYEQLPSDIQWHFIGHLQTNKVKFIVPFVSLIHGVDSEKLLAEINKQAAKAGKKVNCLLQVHIASEESKFGFSEEELISFLHSQRLSEFENVTIKGLMGMATFTDNIQIIREELSSLRKLFEMVVSESNYHLPNFNTLSMGMSDDYKIAIEEGSTMVRIGSKIFGHRIYS